MPIDWETEILNLSTSGQQLTLPTIDWEEEIGTVTAEPQKLTPEDAAYKTLAAETSPLGAFGVGVAEGFRTVGKGLGVAEGFRTVGEKVSLFDDGEGLQKQAYKALQKEYPLTTTIGEILGEAAPFLVPGLGVSAITGVAARILTSIGLGATEGAIIAKGKGKSLLDQIKEAGVGGAIAGAVEAAVPILGRKAGEIIRRFRGQEPSGALFTPDGQPSEELSSAMTAEGITESDLISDAIEALKAQKPFADPEEALRASRLEGLGIPATRGDVSQEFAQQAAEARLVEAAASEAADPLRQLRLEQSRGIESHLQKMISESGIPDTAGTAIKDALTGRKQLMREEKNQLYRIMSDSFETSNEIPVFTNSISDAVPDSNMLDDLASVDPELVGKAETILVKYGILKDEGLVEDYLKGTTRRRPNEIIPLTVGNLDRFRKQLNVLERSDQTGLVKNITGPVKNALDYEVDTMIDVLPESEILGTLKEARSVVREMKVEFSPQSIVGKMVDVKRDGVTPVMEASSIIKKLLAKGTPIEHLSAVIKSLGKAGDDGKRAIGDLQAATALDLLDSAFKAHSRKISGEKVFGGIPFMNRLRDIGDERLNLIFETNPGALKKLKTIKQVSADIQPPAGAIPKGSASFIGDALEKLGILSITRKLPLGVGNVLEGAFTMMAKHGKDKVALEKALKAKPTIKKMVTKLESNFQNLARMMTIIGIAAEQQERSKQQMK